MCKSKDKRFLHRITHNELLAIVPGMDAKGIARIPLETINDNIFENNRMMQEDIIDQIDTRILTHPNQAGVSVHLVR